MKTEAEISTAIQMLEEIIRDAMAKKSGPSDVPYYLGQLYALEWVLGKDSPLEGILGRYAKNAA